MTRKTTKSNAKNKKKNLSLTKSFAIYKNIFYRVVGIKKLRFNKLDL